jgi:hypothetical protein
MKKLLLNFLHEKQDCKTRVKNKSVKQENIFLKLLKNLTDYKLIITFLHNLFLI